MENNEDNFSGLSEGTEERFESSGEQLTEKTSDLSQPQTMDKKRKIAVVALGGITVVLLFAWSSQFKSQINKPFEYNPEEGTGNDNVSFVQEDSEESLRAKDTDKDGLNDWDELNIYKTSPYLEDSDSDGYTDKDEILSNNDPNCPSGKDCGLNLEVEDNGESSVEPKAATTDTASDVGEISIKEQANLLRQALLDAGVPAESFANISDQELLLIYAESMNEAQTAQQQ